MTEITLPSGAILKLYETPFEISLALKEAVMEELRTLPFNANIDFTEIIKNLYCITFSSPKIKKALWECLKRHTYNGLKMEASTFQPAQARQDYETVCMEVAKAEISPFGKEGFAKFALITAELLNSLQSA